MWGLALGIPEGVFGPRVPRSEEALVHPQVGLDTDTGLAPGVTCVASCMQALHSWATTEQKQGVRTHRPGLPHTGPGSPWPKDRPSQSWPCSVRTLPMSQPLPRLFQVWNIPVNLAQVVPSQKGPAFPGGKLDFITREQVLLVQPRTPRPPRSGQLVSGQPAGGAGPRRGLRNPEANCGRLKSDRGMTSVTVLSTVPSALSSCR